MAGFYVMAGKHATHKQVAARDVSRWIHLKKAQASDKLECGTVSVAVAGTASQPVMRIARSGSGAWLCCAGAWAYLGAKPIADTDALLARYEAIGAKALANELDGTYALIAGHAGLGDVTVITDPRGSLHIYVREDASGTAVCTSSMALSAAGQLDPVGAYEFVTTGIIYEDRSMWAGIRKLPPASITTISDGKCTTSTYWSFLDAVRQTLTLEQAAESLESSMVAALKAVGKRYEPVMADLTGGYDSRLLLLGLIESGIRFDNTVAGHTSSPDVITAMQIADRLGLDLTPVDETATFVIDDFQQALRLCDGEYNAVDFARILRNQAPFVATHAASLNGSFGEVARGYWWELLWPHLDRKAPINAAMLARKRFGAVSFTNVFKVQPEGALVQHLTGVVSRVVTPVQDLPLATQMDYLYLMMRMQRWQGRIASNTNQIWPAMAPLGFSSVLTPMLAAQTGSRLRSLLPRYLFATRHTQLANIPLEHGYPPTVATLANIHQFANLYWYYQRKVVQKLRQRGRPLESHNIQPPSARMRYPGLFEHGLDDLLASPKLLASPIFEESRTLEFLNPDVPLIAYKSVQWERLITLEYSLRGIGAVDDLTKLKSERRPRNI